MIFFTLCIKEYLDTPKFSNNDEWFFSYCFGSDIIN